MKAGGQLGPELVPLATRVPSGVRHPPLPCPRDSRAFPCAFLPLLSHHAPCRQPTNPAAHVPTQDLPTQHGGPKPRCRARGGARGVPGCPVTPGRCRTGAGRGSERGAAVSVCIRSGDARPHVTARQPDRSRRRASAGPSAVSSPGRDRADREPRSVLVPARCPRHLPAAPEPWAACRTLPAQGVPRRAQRCGAGLEPALLGHGTRGHGLGRSLAGSGCPGREGLRRDPG